MSGKITPTSKGRGEEFRPLRSYGGKRGIFFANRHAEKNGKKKGPAVADPSSKKLSFQEAAMAGYRTHR